MDNKNYIFYAGLLALGVCSGLLAVNACIGKPAAKTADSKPEEALAIAKKAETGTGVTVVKADEYAETYPLEYESYMRNNENDEVVEYTETNPYIKTMYEGYGFAKSYGSARGHTYVITDLSATGRPHKLANCYTCKTSSFTAEVLNKGDSAYAMNFEDFTDQITDPFGCFHCHGNEVGNGQIVITHGYLSDAVADDFENIAPATLSCGQCHSEYYFDPATKATTFAYTGVAKMNPDDMLAYENSIVDGEGNMFADWVDEDTGVRKIKVQHPEFETYLGEGSPHGAQNAAMSFTCADCHMGKTKAEDGTEYTNHYWTSPLDNQELLESSCAQCHKDLASEVKKVQDETTAREDELGERFAQLDKDLAAAIADGSISGDALEECRMAFRNGQWYWDFVFVENSEGVHNPALTKKCLDKAEEYLDQANALLKK